MDGDKHVWEAQIVGAGVCVTRGMGVKVGVANYLPALSLLAWTAVWSTFVSQDGIPSERTRRNLSGMVGCFTLSTLVTVIHFPCVSHNQAWWSLSVVFV